MVNGHPILPVLGGKAQHDDLPVVGVKRCNITRPLNLPPNMRGPYGRAWCGDLSAARLAADRQSGPDATVCHWIVEAPWSSEVVHSYSIILVHLRFHMGLKPVTRYIDGATHELELWAINPVAPRDYLVQRGIDPSMWLTPPAFAAQIVEASDVAAEKRVTHAVDLITQGRLSPHPAHAQSWCELFNDSMMRVAVAPNTTTE